ncbi:hypothetical protein DID80_02070 [Candidatus Marinamargulisbacteria bacterium SCGC AAA071-K20]|nr:hypothetical protein DID80_02070 [Candidatus Marinamargulisbacteria bacterium SCGC AAA071-K20]
MNKILLRRSLATLILIFLIGCLFISIKAFFLLEKQTALPIQTKIQNELKISVRPFIFPKENLISFTIELESYEHADLAHIDVLASSMLLDDEENPTLPFSWEEKSKNQYNQKGVLFFKDIKGDSTFITLQIYELEEQTFRWELIKKKE